MTPIVPPAQRTYPLLFSFLLLTSVACQGALVIGNGDISAGNYTYTLNYSDEATPSTKFASDIFEASSTVYTPGQTGNVTVINEGASGPRFFSPNPNVQDSNFKTAYFIYKFDFSTTTYRPTALSLFDRIAYFGGDSASGTISSSYSLNGIDYTQIRSLTGTAQPSDFFSSSGETLVELSSQPSAVYYRVDFSVNPSFGFSALWEQWNRLNSDSDTPFTASFTVVPVPEPAGLCNLGAALACFLCFRRRREN